MREDADRGQSIQVGAVLLFGVLILLLATWQAVVVPQENEEVEFNHNRHVQDQVQELRNAILERGSGGSTVGVDVQLGTTYPTRVLFVNPGPPSGSVRTVGTGLDGVNVSVKNASAAGDVGDFWNGSARNYTSGGIVYTPNYNLYNNAPVTAYENSVLYNDFGERNLTLAGQTLVDGNRITLVTLNGSLSRTRTEATTVDVRPVTSSRTRIGVVNATDTDRVTIGLPTQLSAANWTALLDDQLVANGGHVVSVSQGPDIPGTDLHVVNVHLERGVRYRLSLARVGVGTNVDTDIPTAFLTKTMGNATTVPENSTSTLEVRVYDRFNNPVTGESINASTNRAGSSVSVTSTSDADGYVELRYTAPSDIDGGAETDEVNVSFEMQPSTAGSGFDPTTPTNVTFDLTIDNTDGSGTGGGGGAAYSTSWTNPSGQAAVSCPTGPNDPCTVDASQSTSIHLSMSTDPTAADAPVDYGLNDTSVATKNETGDVTNSDGEDTVELSLLDNGWVSAYTTSGGDSDTIDLEVVNYPAISYVDEFHDGPPNNEPGENESIPDGFDEGDLANFASMQAADGSFATMSEEDTINNPFLTGYELSLGTVTRNIPSGSSQTLQIRYATNVDNEAVEVTVVNSNGFEIDAGTSYTLAGTDGSTTTVGFALSAQERSYLNSNGELYLLWDDASGRDATQTILEVYFQRVLSA